nr:hypothetical protein [uncultured Pedobacter sp.]
MNLKKIFREALELYPTFIDISDGELILDVEGQGFMSRKFVGLYEIAEDIAKSKGDWHELFVWIIFQTLHEKAKNSFKQNIFTITREVDQNMFMNFLKLNLKEDGYENMLRDFAEYEKSTKDIF